MRASRRARPESSARRGTITLAEVEQGGWVRVGLLARSGEPVPEHSLEDCIPVTAGAVTVPVRWKDASGYDLPAGEHVRLRFQLTKAKMYAFWFA